MRDGWSISKIKDVATVVTGTTPSSKFTGNWGDSVPFLTPSDMGHHDYVASSERSLSVEATKRMGGRIIESEATAVVCIGATIGKVARVTEPTLTNQQINTIIPTIGKLDPKYSYYLLGTMGEFLLQIASGSATPLLNKSRFENVEILLPTFVEQQRIGAVLGSLDDLIQANIHLMSKLHSLSCEIANDLSVGGDVLSFGDIADVFGGGTPSTKTQEFWNGTIPWATPTDLTALPTPYLFSTARNLTTAGLNACSSKLFPTGSILMTSRATIGAFAINQMPTAVNQGFIVVQPREPQDRWFLFHEMLRRVPEFIQRANGSTFLELSRGVFKSLPISWPSEEVRKLIDEKLNPLHTSTVALQLEIEQLSKTRDELLPLLLSGAITVKDVAA